MVHYWLSFVGNQKFYCTVFFIMKSLVGYCSNAQKNGSERRNPQYIYREFAVLFQGNLLLALLLSIFLGTLMTLIFYPGLLYPDSYVYWDKARLIASGKHEGWGRIWLTPILSFFMSVGYEVTNNYASYTLVQAILFYYSSFLVVIRFFNSKTAILLFGLLFSLFPVAQVCSVHHSPDVVTLICINLLFVYLTKRWGFQESFQNLFGYALVLFFLLTATLIARLNTITILPVLLCMVVLFYRSKKIMFVQIVIMLMAFLFYFSMAKVVQPSNTNQSRSMEPIAWEIVGLIKTIGDESLFNMLDFMGETKKAVDGFNYRTVYHPGNMNSYKDAVVYSDELQKIYVYLMLNYPKAYIVNKLNYWRYALGIGDKLVTYTFNENRWDRMDQYGYRKTKKRTNYLQNFFLFQDDYPLARMPWFIFLLSFASLALLVNNFRENVALKGSIVSLVFLSVSYYGAFLIITPSNGFRYFMPSFFLCLYAIYIGVFALLRRYGLKAKRIIQTYVHIDNKVFANLFFINIPIIFLFGVFLLRPLWLVTVESKLYLNIFLFLFFLLLANTLIETFRREQEWKWSGRIIFILSALLATLLTGASYLPEARYYYQLGKSIQSARTIYQENGIQVVFDSSKSRLFYIGRGGDQDFKKHRFYMHFFPLDSDELKGVESKKLGFNNGDFDFQAGEIIFPKWSEYGSVSVTSRFLPDYPVAFMRTGQYQTEQRFWEMEYNFDWLYMKKFREDSIVPSSVVDRQTQNGFGTTDNRIIFPYSVRNYINIIKTKEIRVHDGTVRPVTRIIRKGKQVHLFYDGVRLSYENGFPHSVALIAPFLLMDYLPESTNVGSLETFSRINLGNPENEQKNAILAHPPHQRIFLGKYTHGEKIIKFNDIKLGYKPMFITHIGLGSPSGSDGVIFKLAINNEVLAEKYISGKNEDTRKWHFWQVDLTQFENKSIDLELRTNKYGNTDFDWAYWGEPRIQLKGDDAW